MAITAPPPIAPPAPPGAPPPQPPKAPRLRHRRRWIIIGTVVGVFAATMIIGNLVPYTPPPPQPEAGAWVGTYHLDASINGSNLSESLTLNGDGTWSVSGEWGSESGAYTAWEETNASDVHAGKTFIILTRGGTDMPWVEMPPEDYHGIPGYDIGYWEGSGLMLDNPLNASGGGLIWKKD